MDIKIRNDFCSTWKYGHIFSYMFKEYRFYMFNLISDIVILAQYSK